MTAPSVVVDGLSLCVIARNEERDLGRCLASARAVVSEIVVVDTGSTDRTAEIARSYGASVVHAPWENDFSAARNRSLAAATGRWALVLDADEELCPSPALGVAVERACQDASIWGYQLRVRNLSPPGEMVEYSDVFLTRLFRVRPEVRYESPIHEQVTPSILRAGGRLVRGDAMILHHGYARTTAQGESRATRNLSVLQALVAVRADDPYVHYQLGCVLQASGEATAAEAALTRARSLDGGTLSRDARSGLFLRLSQLALQRHDDPQAMRLASQSLGEDPENTVALQVFAVASVGAGDVAGGHAAFVRLRQRPDLRQSFAAELDRMIAALKGLASPGAPR